MEPIDLIIMQNTAKLINKNLQEVEFDLKGSLAGRSEPINVDVAETMKNKTLKDKNYL